MKLFVRTLVALGVASVPLVTSAPAMAQAPYPSRTVTLVSPQSPGTALDVLARIYAEKLSQRLGAALDRKSTRLNSSH